jgi:putative ABC transport system permease protein
VLLRLVDAELERDAFEPALEELRAGRIASRRRRGVVGRGLGAAWFRLRELTLVIECLRLQGLRGRGSGGKGRGSMVAVWRDIVYGVRGLVKRPGFALMAVATLALGIGANTGIFSVVNGLLLRPLPFLAPSELVSVDAISAQGYGISVSIPNHRDWRERNRVFAAMGASSGYGMTRRTSEGMDVVQTRIVIGDFFETLGVAPALGRWIRAEESERGAAPVAVIGQDFWQSEFGGDGEVLGRELVLNGVPHTIIGVMPPGFSYPAPEVQVYVPMGAVSDLPWDDRRSSFAEAIARLDSGMTLEAAQRDMDRITREIDEEEGRHVVSVEVRSLNERYRGEAKTPVLLLMGAVALVLLIAGVNVANLLLARGEDRRREMAVRKALGAGQGAIVRQLLAESLLLAGGGALLGLAVAKGVLELIRAYVPLPPLLAGSVTIDGRVLLFTMVLAVVVGLGFGVMPALRASSTRTGGELREGGRGVVGAGRHRLRSALVVSEVALALVLVVAAGLMIGTLAGLRAVDAGFEPRGLLTAAVTAPDASDKQRWLAFHDRVLERMRTEPGVNAAAFMLLLPLGTRSWELLVMPEGVPYERDGGESVLYNIVSAGYFETLGIPILRGRDFAVGDREGSPPVAIIDETMAAKLWPGEDPLGKRITIEVEEGSTDTNPLPVYRTVVGVVPNVRHYELRNPSRVQVYVPLHQSLRNWGSTLYLSVRTLDDAAAFAPVLRSVVRDVDASAPVSRLRPFDEYVARDLAAERALGGLLSAMGTLALGLAAIGVFGVMSLVVRARTREIGVRLALGARPFQVLSMVLGRTLVLAGAGTLLGFAAAATLARLLETFLFEMSPFDVRVYAGAAAFLLAIAAAAALLPALRAAGVDPMRTLRQEG